MIYLKIIIIFLLIIYLFYILNRYIINKKINEHYLTYFLPYYDNKDVSTLTNFYVNNENNYNYFKKNIKLKNIKIGINQNDNIFIETLKIYISNTNIMKIDIIKYNNMMSNINALYTNNINFCLTDCMSLYYYHNNININIDNFKFITNLYKLYIFLFTKKEYNIFSYNDIKPNTIIGIINDKSNSPSFYYYKKFFKDLGYKENIDYIPKFYNNINEIFIALKKNECNILFLIDTYPNNILGNFIDKNIDENIILLPFDISNSEEFINKNKILKYDYIDLNYLSQLYFPKKFGKYSYNVNLPTIKILYTYKILLSNVETDPIYTYDFIKFYNENINYINKMNNNKLLTNNIQDNRYIITDYHHGVYNYYIEKGYITYNNNENCKYLVGKEKCDDESLKNNNLLL